MQQKTNVVDEKEIQEKNITKELSKPEKTEQRAEPKVKTAKEVPSFGSFELSVDTAALKKLKLVTVAYSHIERQYFATRSAYEAEIEVEERAQEVADVIKGLGVPVKVSPGDQYFLTNLLVDKPSLVVNLVDTLKGKDELQTSVPAALELSNIPYTGAGMAGLVIGNDRNITKRLLMAYDIPTPPFQFIRRAGTNIHEELELPLIVKLSNCGGSVGIDNHAVKETYKAAQTKADSLLSTYHSSLIVEQFVDGAEITVCVFDDGVRKHVFMAQKVFRIMPDGKHYFTSFESYEDARAYRYVPVEEPLRSKIAQLAVRAFRGLYHKDYAKFDIRVDEKTNTPYFTDSNPNTAFGPDMGLPFTEVAAMHGVGFETIVASLLSKYAKSLSN